ncbi:MAG: biotin--[acetyl-CoA-carboxylase] ligase [Rhodopirellula sp. JB055]|uniref:biotin--[acetyl-CoA-carboxylase] ligase n=1 Tax=Rhodopirellula sp. JB055 TaxID=3342846 RepID=UPI00370A3E7A
MISSIVRLPTVDSTNSWSLGWLRKATETQLQQELPKLVVAEQQTAGRGRHGKSWFAAEDGLACTLIVQATIELLSIAVGVALAEAIEMVAGPTSVQLKWPNDAWMNERKVAGVLIERHGEGAIRGESYFAIGIGCNLRQHPTLDQVEAGAVPPTSVAEATGKLISKDQILDTLAPHLLEVIEEVRNQPQDLLQRFESRNVLRGKTVVCRIGGRSVQGRCEGLQGDGSLLLRTNEGLLACNSGDVRQLRRHGSI